MISKVRFLSIVLHFLYLWSYINITDCDSLDEEKEHEGNKQKVVDYKEVVEQQEKLIDILQKQNNNLVSHIASMSTKHRDDVVNSLLAMIQQLLSDQQQLINSKQNRMKQYHDTPVTNRRVFKSYTVTPIDHPEQEQEQDDKDALLNNGSFIALPVSHQSRYVSMDGLYE